MEKKIERAGTRQDVTVVIPVYNKEGTLERCLQSVLAQTAPPSRIVIVDDRSTDKSVKIAERLAAADDRLEILRLRRNMGPAHARNRGAEAADTEWIAFLDADDHWHPRFLERVSPEVARTGAGFASSGRIEVVTRGTRCETIVGLDQYELGSTVDLTKDFCRVCRTFFPINSSANLVKRSLFLSVGGFPERNRYWEDHILWSRLWLAGRFVFVNEPLSQYYKAPGTLSGGRFPYRDAFRCQRELMTILVRSFLARRPGTLSLLLYLLRFSILLPISWASRRTRDRTPKRAGHFSRPSRNSREEF